MVSPLFRTLQIATLRYRSEIPDSIIFTNNYESVDVELAAESFSYDVSDTVPDYDLQTAQFSIEYPRESEIELINQTIEVEEGC